jgi:WD40 repeat protein
MIWEIEVSLRTKLEGHEGPITELHFSWDSRPVLSASQDSTIRICSLQTNKEIIKLSFRFSFVNPFVINLTDYVLFSGGSDKAICWWDIERGSPARKLRYHNGVVNSVCSNENASMAIARRFGSVVKIWDCRNSGTNPIQALDNSKDSITNIASSHFEMQSASVYRTLRASDIRESCLTVDSIRKWIVSIELSKDQCTILIWTIDSKILLFMKQTIEAIQTYEGHECSSYAVYPHFAVNDGVIVSRSESGEVLMWELVDAGIEQWLSFAEGSVLDIVVQTVLVFKDVGLAKSEINLFKKTYVA